jgi:hypothetical protein
MSRAARVVVLATALVGIAAYIASAASADPAKAPWARTIAVDCGSRSTSLVAVGNGNWHSALDLNSTAAFVPLAIGDSGVFIDPAGGEHQFSHPLSSKGSASPNGHPIVDCTFSVDEAFPDGSRLIANGTLSGFFTS